MALNSGIFMINRVLNIEEIRARLQAREVSIGSWIQIPDSSVAGILGSRRFDWVAVDMAHGAINHH